MKKYLEELFKENNWEPIEFNGQKVTMSYRIPVKSGQQFKISFLKSAEKVPQGIGVSVDRKKGIIKCNGQEIKHPVFWSKTAPEEFEFTCLTKEKEGTLGIWNIWESPGHKSTEAWTLNAGIIIEEIDPNTVILHCSCGISTPPDFEDLVIKITKV